MQQSCRWSCAKPCSVRSTQTGEWSKGVAVTGEGEGGAFCLRSCCRSGAVSEEGSCKQAQRRCANVQLSSCFPARTHTHTHTQQSGTRHLQQSRGVQHSVAHTNTPHTTCTRARRYITTFLRQSGGWSRWQRACRQARSNRMAGGCSTVEEEEEEPASAGLPGSRAQPSVQAAIDAALREVREVWCCAACHCHKVHSAILPQWLPVI